MHSIHFTDKFAAPSPSPAKPCIPKFSIHVGFLFSLKLHNQFEQLTALNKAVPLLSGG